MKQLGPTQTGELTVGTNVLSRMIGKIAGVENKTGLPTARTLPKMER